ncbi:hypothetical protein PF004_g25166 [Phytophthora fragariae]|uniref:Serine-threonine/tyrosine-protein kinase catalytic domain-containing protein n=1 Tax=Phytophthora fragariae TaxID=53985 RepID=A0A6G0MSV0_9STRA|nr:hypothetical protein PF004_g25166 [Phytophthora fragariae]
MVPVRRRGAFFLLARYRPRRRRVPLSLVLCLTCLLLLARDARAAGDLVARLYSLETAGSSAAKLSLSSSALPSAVTSRLSSYSLAWSDLSGLMQRALLWDSGFVFASPVGSSSASGAGDAVQLVQIFTTCSQGMGDLLPALAEVKTLSDNSSNVCSVENCGIIGHFLPARCPAERVIPLTRCAVYASAMAGQKQFAGVYWAEDGRSMAVPEPVVRRHTPEDTQASDALFAVHLTDASFTGTESCQPHVEFILPCRGVADNVDVSSSSGSASFTANSSSFTEIDLCSATPGAAMNAWLELESTPAAETFSTTAIVLLSVSMLICVGLATSVWWLSRSRAWLQDAYDRAVLEGSWDDGSWSPTSHLLGGPLAPTLAMAGATDEERLTPMEVFFGARPRSRRSPGIRGTSALVATTRAEITLSNDQLCRKSPILRGFVSDPAIVTKRISFAQLHFLRLLAKGGSGEIDTCALPYGFSRNAKMRSMQIVHLVSEGKLLPNFRDDCPPAIRALAQRCLSLDPAARPTAMEVAFELRSSIAPQLLKQPVPTVADDDTGSILSSASASSPSAAHIDIEDEEIGSAPLPSPVPLHSNVIDEDANTKETQTEP